MKKRILPKMILTILPVLCLMAILSFTAFALSWDGSSAGGGGNGSPAGPNGYAIRTTGDNCIGYRFSLVNKTGTNKVAKVIDVFRNTVYGNSQYEAAYKFITKYNKARLIDNQNAGFTTSKNTVNCYLESNSGFATPLPTPDKMGVWQNYATNLNPVLSLLNAGNLSLLKNGDKILVEPIYDIRLEGTYHALTVTEIAIYGKHILGATSNGGASANSASWGFIASYTNKHYPNSLFTPDGQGLWAGVSASASQITFYNIINNGYGVGIAYTETKNDFSPSLNIILCEAWKGESLTTETRFGTSNGNTFENWTYDRGYPTYKDHLWYNVKFSVESENCYVEQTLWIDGGGKVSRRGYSNDMSWYGTALTPSKVSESQSFYIVNARENWIDKNGNVLKYGTVKSFYVPVKPKVNRYQLTAYGITGDVQAYNKNGEQWGKVYVGQRIRTSYTYTSVNTWTSYNDLWAAVQSWDGTQWLSISGADGKKLNAGVNSNQPQVVDSKIGYFVVTDASESGSNVLPAKLTTRWVKDGEHTEESDWLELSCVKADVALSAIRLVDDNGCYADPQNLVPGEHLTIQYQYTNNTKCIVYVNGYNNDRSQIEGVFQIPIWDTVYVEGTDFYVPDVRDFKIWGGVYLENAGLYNTENERNGDNNVLTLKCRVNRRLTLVPIEPNASYKEKTDVITSYWIVNSSSIDYVPGNNVLVKFRSYGPDGSLISECQKEILVPSDDQNLMFFRWSVPDGFDGKDVTVKACFVDDDGREFGYVTNDYSTIPYYVYSPPPDTRFEKKAPDGFTAAGKPQISNVLSIWWRYKYDGTEFYKTRFSMKAHSTGSIAVEPASGFSGVLNERTWTMRSGYGISINATPLYSYTNKLYFSSDPYQSVVGEESIEEDEFIPAQYIVATFPEYDYQIGDGLCRTLVKKTPTAKNWSFEKNGSYGRKHFLPIYYPDGPYYVVDYQSDCWTPAGMLSNLTVSHELIIDKSVYDDWYIGSR